MARVGPPRDARLTVLREHEDGTISRRPDDQASVAESFHHHYIVAKATAVSAMSARCRMMVPRSPMPPAHLRAQLTSVCAAPLWQAQPKSGANLTVPRAADYKFCKDAYWTTSFEVNGLQIWPEVFAPSSVEVQEFRDRDQTGHPAPWLNDGSEVEANWKLNFALLPAEARGDRQLPGVSFPSEGHDDLRGGWRYSTNGEAFGPHAAWLAFKAKCQAEREAQDLAGFGGAEDGSELEEDGTQMEETEAGEPMAQETLSSAGTHLPETPPAAASFGEAEGMEGHGVLEAASALAHADAADAQNFAAEVGGAAHDEAAGAAATMAAMAGVDAPRRAPPAARAAPPSPLAVSGPEAAHMAEQMAADGVTMDAEECAAEARWTAATMAAMAGVESPLRDAPAARAAPPSPLAVAGPEAARMAEQMAADRVAMEAEQCAAEAARAAAIVQCTASLEAAEKVAVGDVLDIAFSPASCHTAVVESTKVYTQAGKEIVQACVIWDDGDHTNRTIILHGPQAVRWTHLKDPQPSILRKGKSHLISLFRSGNARGPIDYLAGCMEEVHGIRAPFGMILNRRVLFTSAAGAKLCHAEKMARMLGGEAGIFAMGLRGGVGEGGVFPKMFDIVGTINSSTEEVKMVYVCVGLFVPLDHQLKPLYLSTLILAMPFGIFGRGFETKTVRVMTGARAYDWSGGDPPIEVFSPVQLENLAHHVVADGSSLVGILGEAFVAQFGQFLINWSPMTAFKVASAVQEGSNILGFLDKHYYTPVRRVPGLQPITIELLVMAANSLSLALLKDNEACARTDTVEKVARDLQLFSREMDKLVKALQAEPFFFMSHGVESDLEYEGLELKLAKLAPALKSARTRAQEAKATGVLASSVRNAQEQLLASGSSSGGGGGGGGGRTRSSSGSGGGRGKRSKEAALGPSPEKPVRARGAPARRCAEPSSEEDEEDEDNDKDGGEDKDQENKESNVSLMDLLNKASSGRPAVKLGAATGTTTLAQHQEQSTELAELRKEVKQLRTDKEAAEARAASLQLQLTEKSAELSGLKHTAAEVGKLRQEMEADKEALRGQLRQEIEKSSAAAARVEEQQNTMVQLRADRNRMEAVVLSLAKVSASDVKAHERASSSNE